MNSLITLSTLFFFNDCTDYVVLFHYYYIEISYFPQYIFFLQWLHALCCFTSLLLNGNLWLYSLRCFTLSTIKTKRLSLITTPFYFTIIKIKSLTTPAALFESTTKISSLFYFRYY